MHRYICLAIADAEGTRRTIFFSLPLARVVSLSFHLFALFLFSSRALAARSWPTTTLSYERANFARKSTRAKERIRGPPRSRNDSGDLRPWVHEGGRDVKKEGRREGDRSRWWRWTRRTSRKMRWWRRTKRHGSWRDTGGERGRRRR